MGLQASLQFLQFPTPPTQTHRLDLFTSPPQRLLCLAFLACRQMKASEGQVEFWIAPVVVHTANHRCGFPEVVPGLIDEFLARLIREILGEAHSGPLQQAV